MRLLTDTNHGCSHSKLEHIGNDHDARFFRCERCRNIFVAQGGFTLAIPAIEAQRRTFDEPSGRNEDPLAP